MRKHKHLFSALLLISTPAMADNPATFDASTLIEIDAQAITMCIINTLTPVSAAQPRTPSSRVSPNAADVLQMRAAAANIDQMLKPDYTAESFR